MGQKNVNFDGYYDEFNVFFDVKILSDKSRAILDGVIHEAKTTLGISEVLILAEYPLDSDFEPFEKARSQLLGELTVSIDAKKKTRSIISKVIPHLTYRLMWNGGTLATVSSYDPYHHAENHHTLLFKHAKKFSKTSPSLIVFVVFPWFSEKTTLHAGGAIFYRAFCRRFFCQYANDSRSPRVLLKSFVGRESIAQVTEALSGVLFLEDKSVTSDIATAQNIGGFAYLK